MRRPLNVALAALALGCARHPAPAADAAPTAAAGPREQPKHATTIRLERGPCHGRCAEYAVTLASDGRVRFEGRRNTRKTGTDSARVKPAAVKQLLARFDSAGFNGLADHYTYDQKVCRRYIADLPTVTTTLTRAGTSKRVEHDRGCQGAPAALTALEQAVDSVANTARWIGPR